MDMLTQLQRGILAVLEEAGEESLGSLRNTADECHGSPGEIDAFSSALRELLEQDYIRVANTRDELSRGWIPLSRTESLTILRDLRPFFQWSAPDQLWHWNEKAALRPHALLTDAGLVVARRILSEDGWHGRRIFG